MRKLLSSFLAVAFAAAVTSGAAVAKTKDTSMGAMAMPMATTCPAGSKWVKGYKTKSGTMVKGYCRKSGKKGNS